MELSVFFERLLQYDDALLRLPYLVRVAVLVGRQKILVSLQRRLGLLQLIVAECADKQLAGRRRFLLRHLVEERESSGIVPRQIVSRGQIFPIGEVLAVKPDRRLQFFFRLGKSRPSERVLKFSANHGFRA